MRWKLRYFVFAGESVPITKTAIPNPLSSAGKEDETSFNLQKHSRHVLFSGTNVIQTRFYGNQKVRAVVLRTGGLCVQVIVLLFLCTIISGLERALMCKLHAPVCPFWGLTGLTHFLPSKLWTTYSYVHSQSQNKRKIHVNFAKHMYKTCGRKFQLPLLVIFFSKEISKAVSNSKKKSITSLYRSW
jgi:hypothetical protein